MVRRIKQYQAEFECETLNKKVQVALHAYSPDGNWLCDCGKFIKDEPWNHRIIREGRRVEAESEKEVSNPITENTGDIRKYHVYYWTGRFPDEKEHITEFLACGDTEAIKIMDKSHISLVKYVLFSNKNKQVKVSN